VRCERRSRVTTAAGHDRRHDLLGEPPGDLVEDRDGKLFDRQKALVEVALGQPGLLADVADGGRGDTAGPEQLESGVEQLLPAGDDPVAGADTAVRARARGGLAGRWLRRGDVEILI